MIKTILLFPAIFAVAALFVNCEKEPQIITETVIETDTIYIVNTDTVIQHITDTVTLTEFIEDTATTFILARHAETTGIGSDPVLSADGQERAVELVRLLKNVSLEAVYATNFNRTKQTAQPAATDKGLTVQIYDPFAPGPLADAVLGNYKARTVLVLGHSNTIPTLLNTLTDTNNFALIPDTQYDNLFVVTVFKKGKATVVHLKYGKPS
jgi:2,3-bisphosphoglycerate-dependent phosphoglycerate mutase